MSDFVSTPSGDTHENDNVLSFVDQAMYLAHSSGSQQAVIQVLWRYDHPIEMEAVERFRDNLARGRLGRLVRPALLPFGRHQWASASPPTTPLIIPSDAIKPDEVQIWADAQVELPIDPVHGPAWNLTLQPLANGSMAISLVVSHCVADGMATWLAIVEAVQGIRRTLPYPNPSSPRGMSHFGKELRRLAQDGSAIFRALGALGRSFIKPRPKDRPKSVPQAIATGDGWDRHVSLPSTFLRIPVADWDNRARSRGARRMTLLTAITVSFALALGRCKDDTVTVLIPINQREGQSDFSGNDVTLATFKVKNGQHEGHLHAFQRQLQKTLLNARRTPDAMQALLPLVPFIPKRAFSVASQIALDALNDMPVTCSFVGDCPPEMLEIAGSTSDRLAFRGTDRRVSQAMIERRQGAATLLASVVSGNLYLNFVAYQPGRVTDSQTLKRIIEQLLAHYEISGEFFDD